jgi:hypothetical protein
MQWIRSHKPAVALGGIAVLGVVAWLAFGIFGVHTLFVDDKVDEAAPRFSSQQTPATSTTTGAPAAPETTTTTAAPVVRTVAAGQFTGRSHPASGRAEVLSDTVQSFLRFEEFQTDNGPDLYVYLSAGVDASSPEDRFDDDFVDLGRLKGNIGSQNYELPAGVDLGTYDTVVVWCRRFAVAFGAADLGPT